MHDHHPLFYPGAGNPCGSTGTRFGACRYLLILLALLSAALPAQAWQKSQHLRPEQIKFTDHLQDYGYVEIEFPHYDDGSPDNGLSYNGENDIPSYISVNGVVVMYMYSVHGYCNVQRDDSWYWCTYVGEWAAGENHVQFLNEKNQWIDLGRGEKKTANITKRSNTNVSYSNVRIYPCPEYLLQGDVNFKVHLDVMNNGHGIAYENYVIESPQNTSFKFKPADAASVKTDLSVTPCYMTLSYSPRSNGDKYKFQLVNGDVLKEGEVSNKSSLVSCDLEISNSTREVDVTQYQKVSQWQYVPRTTRVTVPPYLLPTVEARQNGASNVELKWKVNVWGSSNQNQSGKPQWVVQRSSKSDFSADVIEVCRQDIPANVSSSNEWVYTDETSKQNINGTYYYRVGRSDNSWNWQGRCYGTAKVDITTKHKLIASVHAEMEGPKVRLTWEWNDGNIWTDGSKVMLVRKRVTDSGEVSDAPEELSDAAIQARSYTETPKTKCEEYEYQLYVKPGATSYPTQDPVDADHDDQLYSAEDGEVTSFTASKGYFGDRVELKWTTDGKAIRRFTINSRQHGSGKPFQQIAATEALSYVDTHCVPGIMYDYELVAWVDCTGIETALAGWEDVGFRSPTGEVMGRVAFASGQGEEGVQVRAEVVNNTVIRGHSYTFDGESTLDVTDPTLLDDCPALTVQVWMAPDRNRGNGSMVRKGDDQNRAFEMALDNGRLAFTVGDQTLTSSHDLLPYLDSADFMHVTGSYDGSCLRLYVNGEKIDSLEAVAAMPTEARMPVQMGRGYTGTLDEVRLWQRALSDAEVARDYTRYLSGDEQGLAAYYSFDYAVDEEFYDTSYENGYDYHGRHGVVRGARLGDVVPTLAQLGFKGVTATDGTYSIKPLPYVGSGTTYRLTPTKSNHRFDTEMELRMISQQNTSHTVNFTDVSSFDVSGHIYYKGGNVPVEGVQFYVDGIVAVDDKNAPIITDDRGAFSLQVPVGTHEVWVEKQGHEFEESGRICDLDGKPLNYQDIVSGLKLYDTTTIKYIGRVAGGTVQDGYELGHSLSTNNLGEGVTLELLYQDDRYSMYQDILTEDEPHHVNPDSVLRSNQVTKSANRISIYPNPETGEFVAHIIPTRYKAMLHVPGYESVAESLSGEVDFSHNIVETSNTYKHQIKKLDGTYDEVEDQVTYHAAQKYTVRVQPTIEVTQVQEVRRKKQTAADTANGNDPDQESPSENPESNTEDEYETVYTPLPYFGSEKVPVAQYDGSAIDQPVYADGAYVMGVPVYRTGYDYMLQAFVHEAYRYYDANGDVVTDHPVDQVASDDAQVSFICGPASSTPVDVTAEGGVARVVFKPTEPEATTATSAITVSAKLGENGTSFPWRDGALLQKVYVLGVVTGGNNFVTAGPDKLLAVLRDPPGSNSYAWLEEGTTITHTDKWAGSATQMGSETLKIGYNFATVTFQGVGGGTISVVQKTESGTTHKIEHTEKINATSGKTNITKFNTRFATSSDKGYVGADGDLFIGYSTNFTFGPSHNICLVEKSYYDKVRADADGFFTVLGKSADGNRLLVKHECINMDQKFSTLFAYPQKHIVKTLLPSLQELKLSQLRYDASPSESAYQQEANSTKEPIYLSRLAPDDPNYGKSNTDSVFQNVSGDWTLGNGPSYRIFYPEGVTAQNDTIAYLNNQMALWEKYLYDNEKAKAEVTTKALAQNYSFTGGAPVQYTESHSHSHVYTIDWSVTAGYMGNIGGQTTLLGYEVVMEGSEGFSVNEGSSHSDNDEKSATKGFLLSDSGSDYLSVDVYREADQFFKDGAVVEQDTITSDYLGGFIFRTRGGATSCPYEGERRTRYYRPGQIVLDEATVRVQMPQIAVAKDFVDNIPCGEPAYLTLYMRNNSQTNADCYYDLHILDATTHQGLGLYIDGAPIGNGRSIYCPAGETTVKTLEVRKGASLNYDNVQLTLSSQCESSICDTVSFSVHFVPSASPVRITKPSNNWIYNTKLPTVTVDGLSKHYMEVKISGFNVNYEDFHRIVMQYKPTSAGDDEWTTLMSYYADQALYDDAVSKNFPAEMIRTEDKGVITYRLMLDHLPDQHFDIRAGATSMINNVEVYNYSETLTGIKDMYNPRLFGQPQPANGILNAGDEIRINFNEPIAGGYLIDDNFEITGVRNGARADHSVSVTLDGDNDILTNTLQRNYRGKDVTVELWVNAHEVRQQTYFCHANDRDILALGMTADGHLYVQVNTTQAVSAKPVDFKPDEWAHVAMVYDKEGYVSAYYNWTECIDRARVGRYQATGRYAFGGRLDGTECFKGRMHGARIWNKQLSASTLQVQSLHTLSGQEPNLMACYPMDEGSGQRLTDRAHSATLDLAGAQWSLPEGRALSLSGNQYVLADASAAMVEDNMDFTLELWMKGDASNANSALLSNGLGDGDDAAGSYNNFCLGFWDGVLTYKHSGLKVAARADLLDDNWHHVGVSVSRNNGRGQIYVDGTLDTYFATEGIGGIAAPKIAIGARAYNRKMAGGIAADTVVDRHFQGTIDEVRMWNTYLNENMLSGANNIQLDGTEMGLLAYYPFESYVEHQGINEMVFDLADARKAGASGAQAPVGVAYGGATGTKACAPVKGKGDVSHLQYDFVANNDAIIITLNEHPDRIENTTVTFKVSGVRDLQGNEMLSPVQWSAYINCNQLRWAEESVDIVIDSEEGATFEVDAVNLGGTAISYHIDNMPDWLNVSPASGKLGADSRAAITFRIDQSVSIGTYREVIYLIGDNNVPEALTLNVKVNGNKPDWAVNPNDYECSMSVFGKLRIEGQYSNDPEDMIGAFDGDRCVGVAHNQYFEVNDMYYALLTVYGDKPVGDILEFRVWDASTGTIYLAEPEQADGGGIVFRNDSIAGSIDRPVVFDTTPFQIQRIVLQEGWNWISVNVGDSRLSNINQALPGSDWDKDDMVKSESHKQVASRSSGKWTGTLKFMNNNTMYHIRSAKARTIKFNGRPVPADQVSITVKGKGKWTYLPYLPTQTLSVNEALSGYEATDGDILKSISGFAMYSANFGWVGSCTFMESGQGYMLQRCGADNVVMKYPVVIKDSGMSRAADEAVDAWSCRAYGSNMTILAEVTGVSVADGDRLIASVAGEQRGYASVSVLPDGRQVFFLTIAGDADAPVDLSLERDGHVVAVASGQLSYSPNAALGTVKAPARIDMGNHAADMAVYPNPYVDVLHVRLAVEAEAHVSVEILDGAGRLLQRYTDCNSAGRVAVDWDGSAQPAGSVAIVVICIDGDRQVYKAIKKP